MRRKRFYIIGPDRKEIYRRSKEDIMNAEIPSRPPTKISMIAEKLFSKEDVNAMFSWAMGENWRNDVGDKEIKLFVDIKRAYFHRNLSTQEILLDEWWWTLNNTNNIDYLVQVIHQIWTYFKIKGITESIKAVKK